MTFTLKITCPICGETWEENFAIGRREEIENGGTLDTDCISLKCGKPLEDVPFKVVGIWNYKTCETEYKTTEELLKAFDEYVANNN